MLYELCANRVVVYLSLSEFRVLIVALAQTHLGQDLGWLELFDRYLREE